ncbi:MAG: hypothetical protein FWG62_02235 [Proteobacteria bacterium]|nr:hypothetical protein [Pseudomonadota bacterium]
MRCPKCGFTSFDHLEMCKKCHKYLGNLTEIIGTTYEATTPQFLAIITDKDEEIPVHAQFAENAEESSLFKSATLFEMEEVEPAPMALAEEEEQSPQGTERHEIEFAGFDEEMEAAETAETSDNEEFVLEKDEPAAGPGPAMPALDFGELDISDLAPPVAEQAEPIRFEQQHPLTDREPAAAPALTPPSAAGMGQPGLEDLNTSGLDLDAPAKLITGSAAGKRFLPSVKTGTALDKFDIDLGDLFTDNKK